MTNQELTFNAITELEYELAECKKIATTQENKYFYLIPLSQMEILLYSFKQLVIEEGLNESLKTTSSKKLFNLIKDFRLFVVIKGIFEFLAPTRQLVNSSLELLSITN